MEENFSFKNNYFFLVKLNITNILLFNSFIQYGLLKIKIIPLSGRGRDLIVVGFTTTCVITAYHH